MLLPVEGLPRWGPLGSVAAPTALTDPVRPCLPAERMPGIPQPAQMPGIVRVSWLYSDQDIIGGGTLGC